MYLLHCRTVLLPRNCELAGWFHAHAYQLALNYYRMQLQRDIAFRQPVIEQSCRISYDPDLYYNPAAVPATLEQPLQMPGEPTFRDVKQQEPLPLQRMEAGHERSSSVYLLYQVALKKAIEEVKKGTGGCGRGHVVGPFGRELPAGRHTGGRCAEMVVCEHALPA